MRAETGRLRVAIVGGSLGGLNAALWLQDVGCEVVVFERTPVPLEGRGTGIVLHPATIRYVTTYHRPDLDEISTAARWVRYLSSDGRVLDEEPCRYRFTAYNELYRGLLEHLDTERYHLGEECTGFEQDTDGVTVHFASGREERCDLLVCADGINSVCRQALMPDIQPAYAGYIAWRGTIGEDELTAKTFSSLNEAFVYETMPDGHILSYPIPHHDSVDGRRERLFNWLWYRNIASQDDLDDLLTSRTGDRFRASVPPGFVRDDHLERLRADGAALSPPMTELVNRTQQPFVQVIFDLEVRRMAFGRVCLMGDAAFTARPHAAAGTAKAAEDAWTLANAVRASDGNVAAALAAWEGGQLALGQGLVARSRAAGDRLQHGQWEIGEALPFGLHTVGDNEVDTTGASQQPS